MILSYPLSAPTLTISIRDPNLGDTERMDSQAVVRQNRGGEPLSVNDSDWPINHIRSFSFSALTRTKRDEFENFLKTTAGLEISILDPNSEVWVGFIVSDINEIITIRDDCSYEASFEFLGRKIS